MQNMQTANVIGRAGLRSAGHSDLAVLLNY